MFVITQPYIRPPNSPRHAAVRHLKLPALPAHIRALSLAEAVKPGGGKVVAVMAVGDVVVGRVTYDAHSLSPVVRVLYP